MKSTETAAREKALIERDQKIAKKMQHDGAEGMRSCIHRDTFFNAVDIEGPDIVTEAGSEYWDDMYAMYPHLTLGAKMKKRKGDSINGSRNRFGRVSWRRTKAGWFQYINSRWVRGKGPESKMVYG